jgi:hypothetical protein
MSLLSIKEIPIFNGNTTNSSFMSNSAAPQRDSKRTLSGGASRRPPKERMTKAQLYAQEGLVILIIAGITALAIFAT